MWRWTDGCLLSWLQQCGKIVPAWIVVIVHWTMVSLKLATVSASLPARLCLLYCPGDVPASRHVLDKAVHTSPVVTYWNLAILAPVGISLCTHNGLLSLFMNHDHDDGSSARSERCVADSI